MECSRIRNNIAEYVDGDLPENERRAVSIHLRGCPSCKQQLDLLRQAVAVSAEVLRHPDPEDRFAALRVQMAAADRAAARRKWVQGPFSSGRILRAMAVAAVLVLAVAAILPLLTEGAGNEPAKDVRPAGVVLGNGPVSERMQLIVDNLQAEPAMTHVSLSKKCADELANVAKDPAQAHD